MTAVADEKLSVESLRPADTPEYMMPAWLGCISWALGSPDIVASFRADTGIAWTPGSSPLERMIDEATGADQAFLKAFILWANVNVWGPLDWPDALDD